MSVMSISSSAAAAHESARTATGQFGEQERTAPDVSLPSEPSLGRGLIARQLSRFIEKLPAGHPWRSDAPRLLGVVRSLQDSLPHDVNATDIAEVAGCARSTASRRTSPEMTAGLRR